MDATQGPPAQAGYRFCPHDAAPLETVADREGRPRPTCPRCQYIDYGNPKPGVAVLVARRGQLLLVRRGVEPAFGEWDIPGGFVDPGESAETAALREVREETGLEVRHLRYLGSLPDLYGPRREPTLNLAFLADAPDGTARPRSDATELRWFAPADLPTRMAFDHQRQLLRDWIETLRPGE